MTMNLNTEVTVAEAAEMLGITRVTVRAQYRRGRLRGRRVGAQFLLIDRASVDDYRRTTLGRHGRPKGGGR